MESFWARLQTELLDRQRWRTRVELANAILSTWRSSTTGNDATVPWAGTPRLNSRSFTQPTSPDSHELEVNQRGPDHPNNRGPLSLADDGGSKLTTPAQKHSSTA
jgi:hypothetical protein